MSEYTHDGGVLSSSVPRSPRNEQAHREMFGLYRGTILRVLHSDDKENSSRQRTEYVVKVRGQIYKNAIDVRDKGGIFNYSEYVRKPTEKSFTGDLNSQSFAEDLDGEAVYVMFIAGHGDVPVIIGSDEHPRKSVYKKSKKSDGVFDVEEMNGVEFKVDKNGTYTIQQVGKKDSEGKILNQEAVGAKITLGGADGAISAVTPLGAILSLLPNGSVRIASKDGSYISLDVATGNMTIATAGGDILTMKADQVSLLHSGGSAVLLKDGEAHINSAKIFLGNGASLHAAVAEKVAALYDAHTHPTAMGPSGPPVITTSAQPIKSENVMLIP